MNMIGAAWTGLSTLLGIVNDTVDEVISGIRSWFSSTKEEKTPEKRREERRDALKSRLSEINDEILSLRNRSTIAGSMDEATKKRLRELGEYRKEILEELGEAKSEDAVRSMMDAAESMDIVDVEESSAHLIQYNAFADILGKRCGKCGMPMKLQWPRNDPGVNPARYFWGCTGWYFTTPRGDRRCSNTEKFSFADRKLMTDMDRPEFTLTHDEFTDVMCDDGVQEIVEERMEDLRSDLNARRNGLKLATCPVHGEELVLRRKREGLGLLDNYFLGCRHWRPDGHGCNFVDKLKSPAQFAALLKSQTGHGIL